MLAQPTRAATDTNAVARALLTWHIDQSLVTRVLRGSPVSFDDPRRIRWRSQRYPAGERIGSLYDGYRNAAARAKLPRELRQHDLRHRRVISWLEQGHSPVLVKEAMGHANIATTMGYTHLVAAHLKTLVEPGRVARSKEAVG